MSAYIAHLTQISIYGFLNFFPYLLLIIWPFQNHLRFSKKITAAFILLLTAFEILTEYLSITRFSNYTNFITLINIIIYGISLFIFIKVHIGKLLFTLLMVSNYANFIVIVSTFLSNKLFHCNTYYIGHYTTSIIMFIVQLLFFIPIGYHYKKFYIPTVELDHPRIWNYLWIVPLIFYITWIYLIYYTEDSSYQVALKFSTSLFLLFTTMGAWMIYHIIIKLIQAEKENLVHQEQIYALELQSMQYRTLTKQIEDTRIARHDLRHHITLIDHYVLNQDYANLHEYLIKYKKSLSMDTQIIYCENSSANLIINYYAQQAKNNNISFNISAYLPQSLPLSSITISVLLGNVLENAIEHCTPLSSEPAKITLFIHFSKNVLALSVSNTYSVKAIPEHTSSKPHLESEHGFGLISVKNIVASYNGIYKTTVRDNLYTTEITLSLS